MYLSTYNTRSSHARQTQNARDRRTMFRPGALFPRTTDTAIYRPGPQRTAHPLGLAAVTLVGVYVTGFLVTRVHMFQFAYASHHQQRKNDQWLIAQCADDAFYHNMRHHSDICEQVSQDGHRSIWLSAIDHVVRNTHACGYQSCVSILEDTLSWVLGRGLLFGVGSLVLLVLLPTLTLPLTRLHMLHSAKYPEETDRIRTLRYAALGPLDT